MYKCNLNDENGNTLCYKTVKKCIVWVQFQQSFHFFLTVLLCWHLFSLLTFLYIAGYIFDILLCLIKAFSPVWLLLWSFALLYLFFLFCISPKNIFDQRIPPAFVIYFYIRDFKKFLASEFCTLTIWLADFPVVFSLWLGKKKKRTLWLFVSHDEF